MSRALDALKGVPNAAEPLPGLVTAGQPGPGHIAALKEAGIGVVLDIRDPMEPRPFDEAALARAAGLEYVNVPVNGDTLTDDTMERLLAIVRERASDGVLVHCASGNRVGGPLIAHLMIDKEMTEEDAVAAGMRTGLRSAEILQWGLDFVSRHRP